MKYVLDASVAVKWVLPEADSDTALRIRDEAREGIHQPIAPDFFPIEVGHALTRAERRRIISAADGFSLWTQVLLDCRDLRSSLSLMKRGYVLSSLHQLGMYDCIYAALAETENCTVLTAENRLVAVLPDFTTPLNSL